MSAPKKKALRPSPEAVQDKLDALIKGTKESLMTLATLTVGNKSYTPAAWLAILQGYEAGYAAYAAARSQAAQQLTNLAQAQPQVLAVLRDFEHTVRGALGRQSQALTTFDLKPQKAAAPLTAAQQVVKAAKASATRSARGTLGSRQRAAIKGTLTTAVMVSPTGELVAPPAAAAAATAPVTAQGSTSASN